jgi:ATP-dependent DNA ligase
MPADSDRIGKFIRMLGSSADAEVLKAARDLVSELKADGFDLHAYEIKHDGFRFICRRDGDRA